MSTDNRLPLTLMVRALQEFGAFVLLVVALLMLVVAAVAASSTTEHTLRSDERAHLQAAVNFARERKLASGVIPEPAEFEVWARAMDSKGFRFEGNGFTLDKRCATEPGQFCIYFGVGGDFVTYKSWQHSMERVAFDESPLPVAFGFLIAGLAAAALSVLLASTKARP